MSDIFNLARRPEVELLLLCARVCLNDDQASRLQELVSETTDWNVVLSLARQHGLIPLLYEHLRAVCPEAIPVSLFDCLRDEARKVAANNLFVTRELLQILRLLEVQGITALPYKGPHLAEAAYGNLAWREFTDLDILVRQSDVALARETLIGVGFQDVGPLIPCLNASQQSLHLHLEHHYQLFHPQTGVHLELHWHFSQKHYNFPLRVEHLHVHLIRSPLGGETIFAVAPEEMLLLLCVHGARHVWSNLKWITDLAEWLRRHPALDWNHTFRQAEQYRLKRRLALGLYLAALCCDAPLPAEVTDLIAQDSVLPGLVAQVYRVLFENDCPHNSACFLFYTHTLDRPQDRLCCYYRALVTPTPADYTDWPVLRSLYPLYSTRRLFRLLKRSLYPHK